MVGIKLVSAIIASAVALLGVSLIFASNSDLPGRLAGIDQVRPADSKKQTVTLSATITPTLTITPTATITPTSTITPTATVTSTVSNESASKKAEAIADFFSTLEISGTASLTVTADAVLQLRQEEDMGWGGVFKALYLAAISGQSVDSIIDLRESGMGWGEIEKSLGDKITGKHANLGSAMKAAHVEDDDSDAGAVATATPTATPTTSSLGTKQGKPEKSATPTPSDAGKHSDDDGAQRGKDKSSDSNRGKGK